MCHNMRYLLLLLFVLLHYLYELNIWSIYVINSTRLNVLDVFDIVNVPRPKDKKCCLTFTLLLLLFLYFGSTKASILHFVLII